MNAPGKGWLRTVLCVAAALVLLACGGLMPVHLHALDVAVLNQAARDSAAPTHAMADTKAEPITPYLIHFDNREKTLQRLEKSGSPAVHELLLCRNLTNTVLFPPSASSSGQAFDVAVCICGLLIDDGQVAPGLRDGIVSRASLANRGGDPQPIEEILMDMMSLGQRFDWPHLVTFVDHIEDPQTLTTLAEAARKSGLPVLFAGIEMSRNPAAVAKYVSSFSQTGLADLAVAERFGPAAVNTLLERQQRAYSSRFSQYLAGYVPFGAFTRTTAGYALKDARFALTLKWLFYLCGGFMLALALPSQPAREPRLGMARNVLFASGVLLVVLLLSEPFLAQESQQSEAPFRLRLPSIGSAVAGKIAQEKPSIMNTSNLTTSLLTLLLFFVLQALIYTACLSKLKQNLRQQAPARVKLKLLENEEHLFDAGLYLGFVGTIICLILVSLGVLQFSLMAAYSSTSFGIVFVSILKIFHVRPARRLLLLEAEEESTGVQVQRAPTLVTAS